MILKFEPYSLLNIRNKNLKLECQEIQADNQLFIIKAEQPFTGISGVLKEPGIPLPGLKI